MIGELNLKASVKVDVTKSIVTVEMMKTDISGKYEYGSWLSINNYTGC